VIVQSVYLPVQFSPPHDTPDLSFHQKLNDIAEHIQYKADPEKDEYNGKNPAGLTDIMNFTISHRCQCDYRHVQGVYHTPALNEHISEGTQGHEDKGGHNGNDKVGGAIQLDLPVMGSIVLTGDVRVRAHRFKL
jgi:hypothetical protein